MYNYKRKYFEMLENSDKKNETPPILSDNPAREIGASFIPKKPCKPLSAFLLYSMEVSHLTFYFSRFDQL